MEERYCQSCGMPMGATDEHYGRNADGTKSEDYCKYCYDDGAFSSNDTMEQMIEKCVPFMVEGNPDMTAEKARASMQEFFPNLKRWKRVS